MLGHSARVHGLSGPAVALKQNTRSTLVGIVYTCRECTGDYGDLSGCVCVFFLGGGCLEKGTDHIREK